MGRDLCSSNAALHGDAAVRHFCVLRKASRCLCIIAGHGGEEKKQEKRSWLRSRKHRWAMGEAWKAESKEERDCASIQNKQTQEQTKGREAGSPWRLPVQVNGIKYLRTVCKGSCQDLWEQQKMEDVLPQPGRAGVGHEGSSQGALPTPSWSREAEVGLIFSLTARTKSLFMMGSSLVEPCLNSPKKSRSGLKALSESQSGFYIFFKASSGSKRSLALVHGRWLRRCFSALYIVIFDLNLLLPLLQKAHIFVLVGEISREIPG